MGTPTACAILAALGMLMMISGEESSVTEKEINEISTGQNKLALDLYQLLKDEEEEGNIFISPFSISTCLSMLYLMANGTTADEIAQLMNLTQDRLQIAVGFQNALQSLDNETFSLANRVFIEDDFDVKESYKEIVREYMEAEAENLDFRNQTEMSRKQINSWVTAETEGKITELLKPGSLSADIVMVLVSTIYFKGKWHHPFLNTTQMDFHTLDGNTTKVKMMSIFEKLAYAEISAIGAKVLSIPYQDYNQCLVIILPNEVNGLAETEKKIGGLNFHKEVLGEMKPIAVVNALIPEFKMEETYELRPILKQLGMKSAFNGHVSDFSNAVNVRGLEVSKVYHKTAVEVNQEGTEAAAAAGAGIYLKSGVVIPFRANHPFMFAIVDNKSKTLMFLGRYTGPEE